MKLKDLAKRRGATVAVLIAYLVAYYFSNPFFFRRFTSIESLPNKAVFLMFHVMAIIGLLAAALASKKVFYALAITSSLSILLDNCFFFVKHHPIALDDLSVLFISAGNVTDAIREFRADLLKALATATGVFLCLLFLRHFVREKRYASGIALLLVAMSFSSYLFVAVFRGEPSLVGLPSSDTLLFGGPVLSLDSVIQNLKTPRSFVPAKRDAPLFKSLRRIVLIIDESIEGERFRELNTQPFLNAVDYGYALSGANCSAASNLILRVGPDETALSKTILSTPTLFELAKQANFKTVYFDLQGVLSDTAVRDYFSDRELANVDQVYDRTAFGKKRFEWDLGFAERFSSILSKETQVFAIVNKTGTHFPYAANLPPSLVGSADPYAASVTLSTVAFLHKIDSTLPDSTIVFYTSDHGQNFSAKSRHCNGVSDSTLSEWRVPLFVFTSKDLALTRQALNASWNDSASHFELSETIRVLLGYQPMFNKTLFDPPENLPNAYRAYFGPIKGLLGRPASFREFDRRALNTLTPKALQTSNSRVPSFQ